MAETKPTNEEIAQVFDEIADLLEAQEANAHRVRAYRSGAQSLRTADKPAAEMVSQDRQKELHALPGIGEGLAAVIREVVETGRSGLLDELRGEVSPEELFTQVPGVGREIAERIVDELNIHSLKELELAAHDGRLEQVAGLGPRKIEGIRTSLAGRLSGAARRRMERGGGEAEEADRPSVGLLLEIDREYREKAIANELRKIAPKRFNPENLAWLPILNTRRDGWDFTVLFSNTAQAHELEKTQDWVVIYFKRDDEENQSTVVTETSGPLKGMRVVRGRERETRQHYDQQEKP